MRFPRRDDPTDIGDPDEQMLMDPVHRKLLWGLAKGAVMVAVAVGLVWVAATALQDRANREGQTAMARDQAIPPTPAATSAPALR